MSEPKKIPESLIQAWADFCGIDRTDERAASPNHPGCWPDDFRLFEAGWNAASVIRDFQITEKEIPAAMLDAAANALLNSRTADRDLIADAKAALEAAGVPEMLARIAELEADIATIRGTVDAHNVRLESCDRDGQEFCDCLERAMKGAGGE